MQENVWWFLKAIGFKVWKNNDTINISNQLVIPLFVANSWKTWWITLTSKTLINIRLAKKTIGPRTKRFV